MFAEEKERKIKTLETKKQSITALERKIKIEDRNKNKDGNKKKYRFVF